MPERRTFFPHGVAILTLLLFTAPLFWTSIRAGHHWGGDFSVYIGQARNLVEGQPLYHSTYVVTEQSVRNHPAVYPPLPSILVAPAYAAFGLEYHKLKLALALWAWLSLPLWYGVGIRMGLSRPAAWLATLIFGMAPVLEPVVDTIGSDSVFLFTSAAALYGILWLEQSGWTLRRPVLSALFAALLILLSYATRAVALALIAAFVAHSALQLWSTRKFSPFYWLTILFLGAGLLGYSTWIYSGFQNYGAQIQSTFEPRTLLQNGIFYLRMAAPLWSGAPTPLRYLLAGACIVLTAISLLRPGRQWSIVEPYFLVFYGMVTIYFDDFRYVVPLMLLVLFWSADAALWLGARFLATQPKLPAMALAALAIAASVWTLPSRDTAPITEGIAKPTFQEVVRYLRQTPPGTLLLSWNPRVFAFYTGRPSALYPQRPEDFRGQIPSASGEVLLIAYTQPLDREKLGSFLSAAGQQVTVRFSNPEFTVYEIR